MTFNLSSAAFADGRPIPQKYTGDGDDLSPPLSWQGAPEGRCEFALICDDPDAPSDEPWVHWVIYGIGPEVTSLPEGVPAARPQLDKPIVARQGKNSWNSGVTVGYRGPLPPPGHGTHHYHFRLYALNRQLELPPSATKGEVLLAVQGHVLAEAELVGTYARSA
jgi:Raf kinase inhibitor-like YbhB/YbcL family protein